MEYARGGELFEYIVSRKRVKEKDACKFLHQILDGVEYLHNLGICHRDLKPENLLMDDFNNIKIVDFPYTFKTFTYNTRGFGLLGSDCIHEDGVHFGFDGPLISIKSPTKAWTVSDNKLYNQDGKHVKCIHFASYKNQMDTLFSKEVYDWFERELNVFI
jgi:serine/threonine protein kinase